MCSEWWWYIGWTPPLPCCYYGVCFKFPIWFSVVVCLFWEQWCESLFVRIWIGLNTRNNRCEENFGWEFVESSWPRGHTIEGAMQNTKHKNTHTHIHSLRECLFKCNICDPAYSTLRVGQGANLVHWPQTLSYDRMLFRCSHPCSGICT